MTFLKVLLVIIVVLWLISLIRFGAEARYSGGTFFLKLITGPFRIRVLPAKEKKPKKEKPPKPKKEKAAKVEGETTAAKPKRRLPPIMDLLLLVIEAAGKLKRKIRIDDLTVHLTWASTDPADAAVGFGRMNAAMGMLWGLIENNFKVKEHDLGVAVDFDRDKPEVDCHLALTFTIGQILSMGIRFGVRFLVLWSRSSKDSGKHQEA